MCGGGGRICRKRLVEQVCCCCVRCKCRSCPNGSKAVANILRRISGTDTTLSFRWLQQHLQGGALGVNASEAFPRPHGNPEAVIVNGIDAGSVNALFGHLSEWDRVATLGSHGS